MTKLWITCGAAAALLLASCGGSKEEAKKEETSAPAAAAPAADDANAATVTGKVSFAGAKPTPRTIDMSANPICARAHTTAQKSEEVIVNDNGTLRNTFVWIKSGLPDKQWPVPTTNVSLEQDGCMYKPHVIGVMAGQGIEIKNDDATNHNIHPLPKINQEWNESQPPKGDAKVLFLAGSDAEANASVAGLMQDLGAEPIDLGPIDQGGKLIAMGGPLTNKFKLFTKADALAAIAAVNQ